MIPFKVKQLTNTAKLPEQANKGDLWDLFADDFNNLKVDSFTLSPKQRVLVKTGLAINLPVFFNEFDSEKYWAFNQDPEDVRIESYAVADIRPRSGLALKHGLTVLNTPGTIDNLYRQEIGVIMINHGHEPYIIKKGDKIAQMLIRELAPSSFEVVKDFKNTGRGGFGSTGV